MLHIFSSLVVELDIQDFPTTPCIKAVKAKSGLVWLVWAKLNYDLISKRLKSNYDVKMCTSKAGSTNENSAPPGGAKYN